jgi:hypothetical protein
MAKEQVKVLVQKEDIKALSQKELYSFGQSIVHADTAKDVVEENLSAFDGINKMLTDISDKKIALDSKSADVLARAYISAQYIQAASTVQIDEIKAVVRKELEDTGRLEVKAESCNLKFALSAPKTTVTYDLPMLKEERPEVYREVTNRAGKPMKKADRKALEDEIAAKQAELAELNKKLVEDNAAQEIVFSSDLLDAKIANDDTLAKYRTSVTASKNFYFKNYK